MDIMKLVLLSPHLLLEQGPIRCLGIRIEAEQGVAKMTTFGVHSNQLLLRGTANLNLRREAFQYDAPTLQWRTGATHWQFRATNTHRHIPKHRRAAPIRAGKQNAATTGYLSHDPCRSRLGQPGHAAPTIGAAGTAAGNPMNALAIL